MDSLSSLGAILCAALALSCIYRNVMSRRGMNLPPGPPSDPVIGHLRTIPPEYQERTFAEWAKSYGDIVYAHIFGKSIVILGSLQVAQDLLEKRSAIYSDRPRFVLLRELMGWEGTLSTQPYGDRFRTHRRLLNEHFNPQTLREYFPLQALATATLVQDILRSPSALSDHVKRFAASIIIKISYGHTVMSDSDKYYQLADIAAVRTIQSDSPSMWLVDFIPILKYTPTWFPGAGFKREALSIRKDVSAALDIPFEMVKQKMKSENVYPSISSTLIEKYEKEGKLSASDEDLIKGLAGIIYSGATDPTTAALTTFVLAMVLYPDVYRKAQEEIDRVIGRSRLPEVNDKDSLPYLSAVVTELYRWHTPVALGVPRRVMEDDVYRGYRIPKGATIMINLWAMTQNPDVYPDPQLFLPERFIGNDPAPDPREFIFGFGRRACPGKLFIETTIWLAVASMTATLHISKAFDDHGREISPPCEFTSGFVSFPKPFDCVIRARYEETSDIVARTVASRQL